MATLHEKLMESEIWLKILRNKRMMNEEKEWQERQRQGQEVEALVVVESALDGEEDVEDNLPPTQLPAIAQAELCPAHAALGAAPRRH